MKERYKYNNNLKSAKICPPWKPRGFGNPEEQSHPQAWPLGLRRSHGACMEHLPCAGAWVGRAGWPVTSACVHSRPAELWSPRCVRAEGATAVLLDVTARHLRGPTRDCALQTYRGWGRAEGVPFFHPKERLPVRIATEPPASTCRERGR